MPRRRLTLSAGLWLKAGYAVLTLSRRRLFSGDFLLRWWNAGMPLRCKPVAKPDITRDEILFLEEISNPRVPEHPFKNPEHSSCGGTINPKVGQVHPISWQQHRPPTPVAFPRSVQALQQKVSSKILFPQCLEPFWTWWKLLQGSSIHKRTLHPNVERVLSLL